MALPSGLTPHSNIWIEREGQVVLSRWRVQLLQAVDTAGSISGAAELMGIQYRLAYDRLEEMEQGLGARLVERHVGGAGGGGASLTVTGRDLIERFNRFADTVETALTEQFASAFVLP